MTLLNLISLFAAIGIVFTFVTIYLNRHKSILMTFLQHFCGVWFVFSGVVKAIDPIGTAIKMEQYFAEFSNTFEPTWLSNLSTVFTALSKYSLGFSVFMIILEIMLGVNLIFGIKNRLTAWLFFVIMIFFTILTGFTFLTAFVPQGVTFFQFSKWGVYNASNMRVTDCGCFGDFIKLIPRTSFFKDLFLMIPTLLFLFKTNKMHTIFSKGNSNLILFFGTLACFLFSYRNYAMDEPIIDFRPFKSGVNIPEKKMQEEVAESKVEIIGAIFRNEKTNREEKVDFKSTEDFTKRYSEVIKQYPSDQGWKLTEQIKTESTVPHSKISDFSVSTFDTGSEITDMILENEKYALVIISNKLKYDHIETKNVVVKDSLFKNDTIVVKTSSGDSIQVVKTFDKVVEKTIEKVIHHWNKNFIDEFKTKINSFVTEAKAANVDLYMITAPNDPATIEEFSKAIDAKFNIFYADDIVLKTIMRSNPGVILMKKGTIIEKWHINKLPSFSTIKVNYIK